MKIVVIGGSGLIGKKLIPLLRGRGHEAVSASPSSGVNTLTGEGLAFSIHWNPFQLNPDMPKEGRDRIAYRVQKFGSAERARELDERVGGAAAQGTRRRGRRGEPRPARRRRGSSGPTGSRESTSCASAPGRHSAKNQS
jgi:nucleoside-diphosphate-sugar epimerase